MCGKIPLPNHIPFPPSSPCVTRPTEPLGPQHRHPRARRRNWQAPGKTAATLVFAHHILGDNFQHWGYDMTWPMQWMMDLGSWDSKFRSWQLQSIILQPGPLHHRDTVTSDGKSNMEDGLSGSGVQCVEVRLQTQTHLDGWMSDVRLISFGWYGVVCVCVSLSLSIAICVCVWLCVYLFICWFIVYLFIYFIYLIYLSMCFFIDLFIDWLICFIVLFIDWIVLLFYLFIDWFIYLCVCACIYWCVCICIYMF